MLRSSGMPPRRRPVGVTSGRPEKSAATVSGGWLASTTRPLADANAGVFEPTCVT